MGRVRRTGALGASRGGGSADPPPSPLLPFLPPQNEHLSRAGCQPSVALVRECLSDTTQPLWWEMKRQRGRQTRTQIRHI